MSEKYKILSSFIKDMSSETPDVESFLFTKDNISKYELDIDINSNPLKNNFLVKGKIINRPKKSVANPGIINNKAANAKAAPDIIS